MQRMLSMTLIVVLTFGGLSACGKSEPPPEKKSLKVEDTVFGGLVATKERAKVETEKAMELNKQKLDEAMKKSEDGSTQ